MPTVLRFLSYTAYIYTNDHTPSHVHVESADHEAIFNLNCPHGPPALRQNHGFRKSALNVIQKNLQQNVNDLCKRWRRIHGRY